jgi:hypothetical protein
VLLVAPLAPAHADDTVVIAGDIAPPPGEQNIGDHLTKDRVLGVLAAHPSAVVLADGDIQYPDGQRSYFFSSGGYDGAWGVFRDRTCAVHGNHDWHTPWAAGLVDYFGATTANWTRSCPLGVGSSGRPDRGYWASLLPSGWLLVVLNSECGETAGSPSCAKGSAQDRWLADLLQRHAKRRCILAAWHKPRWANRAPHNDYAPVATFWSRLNHVHADLVVSGHDHAYYRMTAMTPLGHVAPRGEGMREITVGTGGIGLIRFAGSAREGTKFRDDRHLGVVRLTLTPTSWSTRRIRTDGTVDDVAAAGCRP